MGLDVITSRRCPQHRTRDGAAGFIGSNLVRHLLAEWPDRHIVALDALTYSGSLASLEDVLPSENFTFVKGDIRNATTVAELFDQYAIDGVMHLAAESHVDRSITSPMDFIETNVTGTAVLMREAQRAWADRAHARFLHVSTDEVFGSLGDTGHFTETSPYRPNSRTRRRRRAPTISCVPGARRTDCRT